LTSIIGLQASKGITTTLTHMGLQGHVVSSISSKHVILDG